MKKFNTWSAVVILISIMLYATFAFGKEEKGFRNLHSGSYRESGALKSNLHDDSSLSERSNNITKKAVFNSFKTIKIN